MSYLKDSDTPTNGEAAKRPYCYKHSRALLDIGGKKQCTQCVAEARKKEATSGPAK